MCPESKCVPQSAKVLNNLQAASRSKLNPKKKAKDDQNNKAIKPVYRYHTELSEDLSDEPIEKSLFVDLSSLSSAHGSKSSKGKSKDKTAQSDVESIQSSSGGKVGKVEFSDKFKKNNSQLKELPSQMWWVPPLKEPSIYRSPSVTISSKSYSLISSICRPRVIRSADDLRKKVISECKRLEANSCREIIERKEEKNAPKDEGISPNEVATSPSPSLTNTSESTMTITVKTAYPKNGVEKAQSLNGILDFQAECGNDCFSRFETELDFRVSNNSSPSEGKIMSKKAVQSVESQTTFCSQGSQYENLDCQETVRYGAMGDLARKHILNPMAAQLARLCMMQGQVYMNVLEDLEKSCEDFESACTNQSLQKLD